MCTTVTAKQCEKLIKAGRYEIDDMLMKLDMFLLGDRITGDEYKYLTGLMNPTEV